ncbi:hypothetical protein, conserved [Babesia bigemina]|uniref:Uncharacterized protein n=1 Tax=Babesia bigemina TaxID=5866 RepID=A0A061D830_BABBI|nr:hypothetical protein, conserved [Babesia bigemina]CDR93875.1 hypothetical protein, conserved [Babesia bigemina]|eukprot:XP_012766061.1 hypothetical protein, conserved [Babesia bigemina]
MDQRETGEPTGAARGANRPTLFNLLEVLASDAYTTPQQRHSIRGVVTEFLNNKFEHSKVYSYIGAIVGHDVLHSVIKQLESDPDRVPLPDQNGLMRIESAFNLSRTYKAPTHAELPVTVSASAPAPTAPSMQPSGPTSTHFAGGSKEDILRTIRRNLGTRKAPGNLTANKDTLSAVRAASAGVLLQKACWMPIRRSLSAGALYGHSLVCIGSRAYLLGGSNGNPQGVNFGRAHVVSLVNFSSKPMTFTGEIPPPREGNTANVAVIQQSHSVIVFGGFNGERFFNDIHILDLEKRKWMHRRHAAGRVPLPRDEHCAVVYPARCESSQKPKSGAEFLFIFGGKTGLRTQLECLNDMWAYHIDSATWAQVEYPADTKVPAPRFGVCALWADDDVLCVFGGETHGPDGYVDRSERTLLDDLWMFKFSSPTSGTWYQEIYEGSIGPRSHYSSIFIAQRCKELHTGVPRTIERLMLLTGGLTYAPGSKKTVVASDKLYFYFFSQRRWYILKPNYPRNFVGEPFEPRQLHVACFFEKRNILFPGSKPSVPCIFFHGGFHRKQVLSDAWVLSLTGEDLFLSNSVISPSDSSQLKALQTKDRIFPPWYYRESHSPDMLWALCSMQRWAFGGIAHLIANSLKEATSSTRITIKWEQAPQGDRALLSIQDDGNGLDYSAMNKLLKLFGQSKTGERGQAYEYGVGFKMAFARTASGCAVMSRTTDTIGIGMLSVELMSQCESREMSVPLCMWRLPSKELINKEGSRMVDQRHHQRLLMSYSPFNTATLLAEQINMLGTSPGTRMLFWQMRDDMDCVWYSPKDHTLMLKNPLYDDLEISSDEIEAPPPKVSPSWLEVFPLWRSAQYSMDYCLPVYIFWLHLRSSCAISIQDIDLVPYDMRDKVAQAAEAANASSEELTTEDECMVTSAQPMSVQQFQVQPLQDHPLQAQLQAHPMPLQQFQVQPLQDHPLQAQLQAHPMPLQQFQVQPLQAHHLQAHLQAEQHQDQPLLAHHLQAEHHQDQPLLVHHLQDEQHQEQHLLSHPLQAEQHQDQPLLAHHLQAEHHQDQPLLAHHLQAEHHQEQHLLAHPLQAHPLQARQLQAQQHQEQHLLAHPLQAQRHQAHQLQAFQEAAHQLQAQQLQAQQLPAHQLQANQEPKHLLQTHQEPKHLLQAHQEPAHQLQAQKLQVQQLQVQPMPPLKRHHPLPQQMQHPSQQLQEQEEPSEPARKEVYNCQSTGCTYCGVAPVDRGLCDDRSLWSFLRRRLFCRVQLPYLFAPSDHKHGCCAMIGFLNRPHFCGPEDVEEVTCDVSGERVCETGVLLYFRGRLISRLEGHFPAPTSEIESAREPPKESLFKGELYRFALTAVVNVPEWLIPSATKQEFVQENNKAFFDFKSKLMGLISEYSKVCSNRAERKAWESHRLQQLIAYDQRQEQLRIERTISDQNEETLPIWRNEADREMAPGDLAEVPALINQEPLRPYEHLQ